MVWYGMYRMKKIQYRTTVKTVTFHNEASVVLIPSRNEYVSANIFHDVWYTTTEMMECIKQYRHDKKQEQEREREE